MFAGHTSEGIMAKELETPAVVTHPRQREMIIHCFLSLRPVYALLGAPPECTT